MGADSLTVLGRPGTWRVRVAAGALALAVLACGPADEESTSSTLGPDIESDELALGPGSSTTADDELGGGDADDLDGDSTEETVTTEPVGPPLPPSSTAEQILAVVSEVHGPTTDVAAQMNRLVRFPEIPTPADAAVTGLRVDVRNTGTPAALTTIAEVTISSSEAAEDVVELYRSGFDDLGWVEATTSNLSLGSAPLLRLDFEIPDSLYPRADVSATIAEVGDGDGPRTEIRIRHVEVTEETEGRSTRQRFESWIGDLPLPEGGAVGGAGIQTNAVGRRSLHYSLTLDYSGVAPDQLAEGVRSGLPSDEGFVLVPRPEGGSALADWVYLDHPFFTDARVTPEPVGPINAPTGTQAHVYGRVDLPASPQP